VDRKKDENTIEKTAEPGKKKIKKDKEGKKNEQ